MRVIVDMPDELVAELDAAGRRWDRPRAWIIRNACATWLDEAEWHTPKPVDPSDPGSAVQVGPNSYAVGPEQFAVRTAQLRAASCPGFTPSPSNALRCDACGQRKGAH
jgi:hypothetical protein